MTNRYRLGNRVVKMAVAACNRAVAKNEIMVGRGGSCNGETPQWAVPSVT